MTTGNTRHESLEVTDGCFQMWRDYMDLRWTLSQLLQHQGFMRAGSSSNVSSTSASSSRGLRTPCDFCEFCHKNGEMPVVCMSHRLKARDGRILCPILRSYVCESMDSVNTVRLCSTFVVKICSKTSCLHVNG
uniref:Nanos-type domain-containing protein n=1 Tax=Sinocyclocheilus grahami TaxID=75366 RepID=A0A672SIB5_SINGR